MLAELSRDVDAQCLSFEAQLHSLAGRVFNVNSNAQLAQVLYTDLALPVLKKGKTGPSTDAEVLEKLAEKHPLPRALLEYRTLSKLKSTYLDALVPLVAVDGRLHTTFHQAATATGPAVQLGPEPPEHPGAHGDGPGHPPGLRGRAGVEAGLGGLQPDRAAHPGARVRGSRAALGVPGATRTCTSAPRPRCSA